MLLKRRVITVGFVIAATLCGCAEDSTRPDALVTTNEQPTQTQGEQAHVHPSEGPHGGHLIELGGHAYHAELLHDDATHTVAVHVLDASGKQHVPIEQNEIALVVFKDGQFIEHALQATNGKSPSAEFSVISEDLCNMLTSEEVRGRLNVTIEGQAYQGVMEHHAHDHADH